MIKGIENATAPLQMTSINPYCSVAYIKQNNQMINPNALINPNFLIWQRYVGTPGQEEIDISYSDLIENQGYLADKWYIKNLQFGSQEIKITKDIALFNKNQNLTNSVVISTGNTPVESLGMNVALSQDISGDKLFNILGDSAVISFYVKSSIAGSFTCALTLFNRNSGEKYIKLRSFRIRQPNTTQKVTLYYNNVNFPNLILDRHDISASIDISISGVNSISDSEWHTYGIDDAVITCLNNQTNLFTGNNDYIQISNIGLQSCIVGHSSFPELNNIDYNKDLIECQEFFERVFIPKLNIFYRNSSEIYSFWDANFKLNTIKRNKDLTFDIKNRSNELYYKTPDNICACDISSIGGLHLYTNIGTQYNRKDCFLTVTASQVSDENIFYSYLNDFIVDVY